MARIANRITMGRPTKNLVDADHEFGRNDLNASFENRYTDAVALHQQGETEAAIALYRQLLQEQPEHLDTRYLLGTALLQRGQFTEALPLLQTVVEQRPDVAEAHNNLGIAFQALGDWEQAVRSFQAALKVNPEYDRGWFNLGSVMERRGLNTDAEKCFRRTLELAPDDPQVRISLGNVLKSQERWGEAEAYYRSCRETVGFAETDEFETETAVGLAFVLAKQERLDEAAELYRNLLSEQPEFAQIHSSLSFIHERQGRLSEATVSARRAVELKSDYADGFNNLGIALRSQHRLEEASDAFRQALRIQADFPLAEFNLGTTHLLAGDYPQGWPGYEKRVAAVGDLPRKFDQPQWDGRLLPNGRLFVFTDQGFGDAIQFARFLAEAKRRSQAQVIFECQPELTELLTGLKGVDEILPTGTPPPEFDVWISLASLPGLFGVALDSIPANVPYLSVPTEIRSELQTLLSVNPQGGKKIGFVWQGNPRQARDVVRSCSLETFLPLFEMDGVEAFSLQTGDWGREQLSPVPLDRRPVDLGVELQSFAETAAVIEQLDLLIGVDTAVVHLAGAMGVPVWTLLCHTPDWRWGLTGESSAWYPSMRLFRQPKWGDWNSVLDVILRIWKSKLSSEK